MRCRSLCVCVTSVCVCDGTRVPPVHMHKHVAIRVTHSPISVRFIAVRFSLAVFLSFFLFLSHLIPSSVPSLSLFFGRALSFSRYRSNVHEEAYKSGALYTVPIFVARTRRNRGVLRRRNGVIQELTLQSCARNT